MTYDFHLAHPCPHLTVEEEVLLGSDRVSLVPRQPIATSSRVRLTANGQTIPSGGVLAGAELVGSISGPFRIQKGSEKIEVRNRTKVLSTHLPVGTRVPTSEVVSLLNKLSLQGTLGITFEDRGYLAVLDTSESGPSSRISVRGLVAPSLGFVQYQTKGRVVYPTWGFADIPVIIATQGISGVRDISSKYVRFTSPIRGNPVFKLTYTTFQAGCRRCQSTGIENDFKVLASGDLLRVENEDKLNQGVLKIISTIRGSNPFHPEYGSDLLKRIGTKALDATALLINEDVSRAINVFRRTQDVQARYQEVTARERLGRVLSINTTPAPQHLTVFEVAVLATTASNTPVDIRTVYAAPGTAALAGSNGLSLGLDGFGLDPRTRTLPGID